jgi:hypothetical protein
MPGAPMVNVLFCALMAKAMICDPTAVGAAVWGPINPKPRRPTKPGAEPDDRAEPGDNRAVPGPFNAVANPCWPGVNDAPCEAVKPKSGTMAGSICAVPSWPMVVPSPCCPIPKPRLWSVCSRGPIIGKPPRDVATAVGFPTCSAIKLMLDRVRYSSGPGSEQRDKPPVPLLRQCNISYFSPWIWNSTETPLTDHSQWAVCKRTGTGC